ncbi:uncharacterized protein LOC129808707 [Phlebotomus papatasi]|uniref:uncharacterized protein LOC129808707 n=1 Tax=Phlebotomus papatasi TaxID=29031 RepID=UPI00248380F5|nr:uncharacterized protein LOC129808707 [Phlebotomus papatasi]
MLCNAAKKETPFKNNRPGRTWYRSFMRRHPILSERISQNLSTARAEITKEDIRMWFSKVEDFLIKKDLINIDPSRIFNCDETAMALCPKGGNVLAEVSPNDAMTEETVEEIITSDIENDFLQNESPELASSTNASDMFSVRSIEEDLPPKILEQFLSDENYGVFRGPIE